MRCEPCRLLDNDSTPSISVVPPWASSQLQSSYVHPGMLQVYGLPVDTILESIEIDLSNSSDQRRLQSRLAGWVSIDYYPSVCGTLLEAISDTLVPHCHINFNGVYISSRIQDNRRKLFNALEQKQGHDTVEFRDFLNALPDIMRGRCIVLTRSGYIGISCNDAKPGDKVVVLRNSPVSFVFRELANSSVVIKKAISKPDVAGAYELIGDVYIHALNFLSFNRLDPKPLLIY